MCPFLFVGQISSARPVTFRGLCLVAFLHVHSFPSCGGFVLAFSVWLVCVIVVVVDDCGGSWSFPWLSTLHARLHR